MGSAGIASVVSKIADAAAARVLDFELAGSGPCHLIDLTESSLALIMTVLIVYEPLGAHQIVKMLLMQKVLHFGVILSCLVPQVTEMPLVVMWSAVPQNSFVNGALHQNPLPTSVPELLLKPVASIVLDAGQQLQDHPLPLPLPQFHLK